METLEAFERDKSVLLRKLNEILPNFGEDIHHVVNVIMHCVEMNKRKKFIDKVNIKFLPSLYKIILCQNQINNLDAHPIGIELSNFFNAANAQTILNVKHLNVSQSNTNGMVPSINSIILHQQTKNKTWFRLRCLDVNKVCDNLRRQFMNCETNVLNDEILEVVYTTEERSGLATERAHYDKYKTIFEADDNVSEIIFYSNCRCLIEIEVNNVNLIYSNIFKFYFCHLFHRLDTTYLQTDILDCIFLQIHCYMLMINQNFNTNNSGNLEPMSLLSSEKNTAALAMTQSGVFATEAPRDMQYLGDGSSIGGKNKAMVRVTIKDSMKRNIEEICNK